MSSIDEKKINSLKEIDGMRIYWQKRVKEYEESKSEAVFCFLEEKCEKAMAKITLNQDVSDKIEDITKGNIFAEYVLLFSVYQILCLRYQNSKCEAVMTPAFGGKDNNSKNWVFITIDDSEQESFKKLLNANLKKLKEVFANQFYSLDEIMNDKQGVLNTLSKNIFVLETSQNKAVLNKYINTEYNDFSFVIGKNQGNPEVKFYYCQDKMTEEDAISVLKKYEEYLKLVLSDMDNSIEKLFLLEDEDSADNEYSEMLNYSEECPDIPEFIYTNGNKLFRYIYTNNITCFKCSSAQLNLLMHTNSYKKTGFKDIVKKIIVEDKYFIIRDLKKCLKENKLRLYCVSNLAKGKKLVMEYAGQESITGRGIPDGEWFYKVKNSYGSRQFNLAKGEIFAKEYDNNYISTGLTGYKKKNGEIIILEDQFSYFIYSGKKYPVERMINKIVEEEKFSYASFICDSSKNLEFIYIVTDNKEINKSECQETIAKKLNLDEKIRCVFNTKLPINSDGYADENAIRFYGNNLSLTTNVIEPKNEKEANVLAIFKKILADDTINMESNFFDFGGDSIKAIQISAHLKEVGFKLDLADILRLQVISKIADSVTVEKNTYNQGIYEGEVGLLPVQERFFINKEESYNVFNHSITLFNRSGIDESAAREAYFDVVQHHDALRIICVNKENEVKQIIKNNGKDSYTFETKDLTGNPDFKKVIEEDIDSIQQKLDIFNGKISYIKLFKTKEGDYLSLTIHHMVVDGISWRIILEDFMAAYNMHKNGMSVELPMKTAPFFEWVKDVHKYADNISEWEQDYWKNVINVEKKFAITDMDNTWRKHKKKIYFLTEEETEILSKKMNKAFHSEISDILLAGLGMASLKYNQNNQTMVAIEGHGREKAVSNHDVSRTVGWFTTYYHAVFENDRDVMKQITKVKKALCEVPHKGISYGIIKYHNEKCREFSYIKSQILFNYLGEADSSLSEEFQLADGLKTIQNIHEDYDSGYLLSINSILLHNKLQFIIDYNEDIYCEEEINGFMQSYLESISEIIEVGLVRIEQQLCKFDLVDLTQEENKELNKKYGLKNIDDVMPLSLMQQGMYYHWKISEEKDLYCEQYMYDLQGSIDYRIFENSVRDVVKKNQVLRTVFIEENMSNVYQVILSDMPVKCEYIDLKNIENSDNEIAVIRERDRKKGFNLYKGPMIRLYILDCDSEKFHILLSFHHIIMDGWSVPIILMQLIDTYIRLKMGHSLEDKNNRMQFKEYMNWFRKKNNLESIYFWKEYLKDVDTVTMLPYQNKSKVNTYAAKKYTRILSIEKEKLLNSLAGTKGVTLFQLLQSAWSVLLGKYNRNNTVVFGTVVSGRPIELQGSDELTGLCINTIPVVRNISDNETFTEFLSNVSEIDMNKHSLFQLVEIQNLSQLKTNLISHILIFENYPLDEKLKSGEYVKKMGFSFENVDEFWKTNYDFNLMLVPNDGIEITVIYNENKFMTGGIEKIISQFCNVLDHILEKPDVKISEISIVSDEEKQMIIEQAYSRKFNLDDAQPLYKIIEKSVEKYSDCPAVSFQGEELTYSELNTRANKYAEYLRKSGAGKNEVVGVLMDRSHKMPAVLLGILKCGCAYLPLDKLNPRERLNYMIEDSKIRFLFISEGLQELIDYNGKYLYINEIWDKNEEISNQFSETNIHELMYMIYTSGSTGKPKAVCLEHKSVYNFMISMKMELPYENIVMLCVTTMAFDIFGLEVYLPLMYGQKIVIAKEEAQINPVLLAEVIEKNAVNTIQMTPSRMKIFLASDKAKDSLKQIRVIILGGEPLTAEIVEGIRQFTDARIFNVYGPTETTIWSSIYEIKDSNNISIGRPIGNNSFYILDDNNRLVPNGIPGELVIGGDSLARGYYNRDDITKEKFVDNIFENKGKMYKTGDIVVRENDGNISYIGRKDFQLKMHGFRIELGEIENCLVKEMKWTDVVVQPVDVDGEMALTAYYVNDTEMDYDTVINKISKILPYYMLPAYIIKVDKIPTNVSGKADRNALKKIPVIKRERKINELPSTEMERIVYDIWKENLNISNFDINDNFFHIGGHSLKAIKVCTVLSSNGYNVGVNDLYQMPTVKMFAEFIEKTNRESAKINDKQKMIEYLSEKYSSYSMESIGDDNQKYTVLKLNVSQESLGEIKEDIKVKISKKIRPDYIICNNDESDKLLLENTEKTVSEIINDIEMSYEKLSSEIKKKDIEISYNISGAQKIRMSDPQNIVAYFETDASYEEIENIMCEIINEQSLMRSFLIIKDDEYAWEQHTKIDRIHMTYADFSEYTPQACESAVHKIAENMFNSKLEDETHILYQMVYIKINENTTRMLLISNHIIFDGFSSEILAKSVKNKMYGIRKNDSVKEYSEYVKLVNEKPKEIEYEDIKKLIKFAQYTNAINELDKQMQKYDLSNFTVLNYDIDISNADISQMDMFELSYKIFMMYCNMYFQMQEYPLILVVYGRKYCKREFFDTIGEFIDYVPFLADSKLSVEEFVKQTTTQNSLFEEHNINFATLINDIDCYEKDGTVKNFIEDVNKKPVIIFNYQGLDNTEKQNLAEIIDNNTEYMMNRLIRFSTKVFDNKLNIYIYMPFLLSQEENKKIKSQTVSIVDEFRK